MERHLPTLILAQPVEFSLEIAELLVVWIGAPGVRDYRQRFIDPPLRY
jgi:hypothetical protein